MIGNYATRSAATQDDVTAILAGDFKSKPLECANRLSA
jgi:hypothetical protein